MAEPTTAPRPLLLAMLAEQLTGLHGTWTVDGDHVRGPGTLRLEVADHPGVRAPAGTCHIDVGVRLRPDRADAPVLWDCATGFGATPAEAQASAVQVWTEMTGRVVLELLTQRGQFADHVDARSRDGLAGRHTIQGAVRFWGMGPGAETLQRWWLANPLLPVLLPALAPWLSPLLSSVRIFFGSQAGHDTAEVLVDRRPVPAAQDALLALDWPRTTEAAYARTFLVTMPGDDADDPAEGRR